MSLFKDVLAFSKDFRRGLSSFILLERLSIPPKAVKHLMMWFVDSVLSDPESPGTIID